MIFIIIVVKDYILRDRRDKTMEIKYTRCRECGYVYQDGLCKCPQCGATQPITENIGDNEPTFNILD